MGAVATAGPSVDAAAPFIVLSPVLPSFAPGKMSLVGKWKMDHATDNNIPEGARGQGIQFGPEAEAMKIIWVEETIRKADDTELGLGLANRKFDVGTHVILWKNLPSVEPQYLSWTFNDDGTISPKDHKDVVIGMDPDSNRPLLVEATNVAQRLIFFNPMTATIESPVLPCFAPGRMSLVGKWKMDHSTDNNIPEGARGQGIQFGPEAEAMSMIKVEETIRKADDTELGLGLANRKFDVGTHVILWKNLPSVEPQYLSWTFQDIGTISPKGHDNVVIGMDPGSNRPVLVEATNVQQRLFFRNTRKLLSAVVAFGDGKNESKMALVAKNKFDHITNTNLPEGARGQGIQLGPEAEAVLLYLMEDDTILKEDDRELGLGLAQRKYDVGTPVLFFKNVASVEQPHIFWKRRADGLISPKDHDDVVIGMKPDTTQVVLVEATNAAHRLVFGPGSACAKKGGY